MFFDNIVYNYDIPGCWPIMLVYIMIDYSKKQYMDVPSILMTAKRARVCSCWALCCSAHPAWKILSAPRPPLLRDEVSDPALDSSVDRRIASPISPYRMPMIVIGAMKNRKVEASNAWDR